MPLVSSEKVVARPMRNAYSSDVAVVGLEIAESATAISAYVETDRVSQRKRLRLSQPPTPDVALARIHDLILRALSDAPAVETPPESPLPPLRLGVAFWGRLDRDRGAVRELRQNPSWNDFPLAETLSARYGGPVALETAVNAAAWGEEAERAGGVAAGSLLYLHVGREISAAAVQDGHLLVRHDAVEERFGHSTVAVSGPRCRCGGYGHLTPVASAQSLVRSMIGRAVEDEESYRVMLEITGGRAEALTAPQVVQLATAGNAVAADIVAIALDALALALSNAVLLLSSSAVIIGGPLTEAGETFLAPLRARMVTLLGDSMPLPSLSMATLEPYSSLRGAHALARVQP
jgi:glucokinase